MTKPHWIVLAVLALALTNPAAVTSSQQLNPTPTPVSPLIGIQGLEDVAQRDFIATGGTFDRTLFLSFLVMRFSSEDAARDGLEPYESNVLQRLEGNSTPALRTATTRSLGDEIRAVAGEIQINDPDGIFDSLVIAHVLVRDGSYIHQAIGGAILWGDPLVDALNVLEKTVGRAPGNETIKIASNGMRVGGLWDMLPLLNDLPEGFVFDEESEPQIEGHQDSSPASVPRHAELKNVHDALVNAGLDVEYGRLLARVDELTSVVGQQLIVEGKSAFVFIFTSPEVRQTETEGLSVDDIELLDPLGNPVTADALTMFQGSNVVVILVGGGESLAETIESAISEIP
jgi:hypothetical protein